MIGTGQAPTRAAVLEMTNEQVVVREAYDFLDEKRLLLASELLRQLRIYQQLNEQLDNLHANAKDAMVAAVRFHGLNGLQVYPAASIDSAGFIQSTRNFMGVTLVDSKLQTEANITTHAPPYTRPVLQNTRSNAIARSCRKARSWRVCRAIFTACLPSTASPSAVHAHWKMSSCLKSNKRCTI